MMRRRLAAATGVLGILLMSGCGSSGGGSGEIDKSTDQIIRDMAAAIKSVHSFHISGSVVSSGSTVGLDLTVAGPQSVSGSITEKGATAHLVLVNGALYFMGKQFFAVFANPQAAALLDDNSVKMPASTGSSVESSFGVFTNTSTLSDCFAGVKSTTLAKTASTVNGVAVVQLTNGGHTLDVAANGPTYPVRFTGSGSDPLFQSSNPACSSGSWSAGSSGSSSSGSGSILFDSWGASSSVTPPPSPIDLSSVGG
jgi:hypothetical protein